jgi:hypothetical protein
MNSILLTQTLISFTTNKFQIEMENYNESWSACRKALYWDQQGNWDKAHTIVQELSSADAAWVHAYLHRKEGDEWNASYWYTRAGKPFFDLSLKEEWEVLWDYFKKVNRKEEDAE